MFIVVYLEQIMLFTLYIDKLLIRLKHAHIGYHINNIFAGALSYADDITLLCPSICGINKMIDICGINKMIDICGINKMIDICGINKMIDICCEYVEEYDIKFHPTKTVCIKYGDKVQLYEHVVMNDNTIEWSNNVRHLVNFVDVTLSDSLDCRYNRSMCIGYVNKLISKFGH